MAPRTCSQDWYFAEQLENPEALRGELTRSYRSSEVNLNNADSRLQGQD